MPKKKKKNEKEKKTEEKGDKNLINHFHNVQLSLLWKVNWSTWHERGTKKKIPYRNRIYNLPSTGQALFPLNYETQEKQGRFAKFMCDRRPAYCLGSALSKSSWVW